MLAGQAFARKFYVQTLLVLSCSNLNSVKFKKFSFNLILHTLHKLLLIYIHI